MKKEIFARYSDDAAPGYTEKIIRFCRKFGKFRPRLVTIDGVTSLADALTLSANEHAISLQPPFISHLNIPSSVLLDALTNKAGKQETP